MVPSRHYGMDWLRIGAFAILILYHIGMVFVPWGYHVKAQPILPWVTIPMLFPNAWRLMLLFVVSGYASRALLDRQPEPGRFAWSRSLRLLVPLAFGIAVIVPPQPWVELVTKGGYREGFLHFWWAHYFDFVRIGGLILPTWNHLWFVAYLWVYTMALAAGAALVRGGWAQRAFDRMLGGWRVLALPILWLALVWLVIIPDVGETHDLINDPVAHLTYLPAFLFGVALRGSEGVMAAIRRWWKWGAALSLAGFAAVVAFEIAWMGHEAPRFVLTPFRIARAFQAWGGIVALIGIADRWWNRDHPWRATLTEAVFPFYIVHQTIIVVVAYWLLQANLPAIVDFPILVAATVAGCWAFYLVGREVAPLRPLIGLRRRTRPAKQPAVA